MKRISAQEELQISARSIVQPLATRLGANSHLYFELGSTTAKELTIAVRYRPPEEAVLSEYGERFYEDDPLTQPFRSWLQGEGTTVPAPLVVALRELPQAAKTSYEARFLHRARIHDVIGLGIPMSLAGARKVLCFGMHRCATDPWFNGSDAKTLRRAATTLRVRAENLALHEQLALRDQITDAFSHSGMHNWIVFDSQLRVRDMRGDTLCRSRSGSTILESVRAQLEACRSAKDSRTRSISLRVHSGVEGNEATALAHEIVGEGGERWWLVHTDTASRSIIDRAVNSLFDAAGLTAREREVALVVAEGASNADVARALRISVLTVENHLRSVYSKLGISSRLQLLRAMHDASATPAPE
ncbi:helix-turn-helix domain-containing protein [Paraburkholderia hospita]|uniref:Response regulator receiver protein n=1 Tax=Paraburkholderia hospita TaxID=169430 RepID=A0ABN0FMC9_9BURK|nr:helix-turn-helix transcriptional regulator [Paraburkholderia hospita]EIM99927.1 response regulator receiver protein [Paraburkholderia hospita]OUL72960.1 helix-turn-helix transcriptional regulator [Paraburkholderia hospita]SEI15499.1 regulatory protein, luxR family [Paraburkholderia hospita]